MRRSGARQAPITSARKAPRQERSRTTVDAILDATARVLVACGYTGTNTNLVAETAGVSVGSLYQYFPNKAALVAALHRRHAGEILAAMGRAMAVRRSGSLDAVVRSMIGAVLQAHLVDPQLHRVLESEVPDLDRFDGMDEVDRIVFDRVRDVLSAHRDELSVANLDLATFVVLRVVDTLVHAAVIDPPETFTPADIEREISRVVLGYLTAGVV